MNTENVYIVILLVLGIVVLTNLAMFAMVRGSRGIKFDWFNGSGNAFTRPFKKADDTLDELHQKVEALSKQGQEDND